MRQYQLTFIDLALKRDALRFGNFALKSGRASPYFFNAGLFSDGEALATLGNRSEEHTSELQSRRDLVCRLLLEKKKKKKKKHTNLNSNKTLSEIKSWNSEYC